MFWMFFCLKLSSKGLLKGIIMTGTRLELGLDEVFIPSALPCSALGGVWQYASGMDQRLRQEGSAGR